MSNKLFSNNPTDLEQVDGDLFGTRDKAEAIKEFLESIDTTEKDPIKMICLYGNWGSGKSSIIKYLQTKLSENSNMKTKLFEAWQHEKDNDLTLSLSECIASLEKTEVTEITDLVKNFITKSYILFKSGLSSIGFTLPITPPDPLIGNASMSVKPIDSINYIENEIKKNYDKLSFYTKLENFKKSFIDLEDSILGKDNDNKIIIFIDDLDRCEPEHVISILSAIKNFFIYGKRTIFFCALDKDAVSKAITTKYKDVIKSEEYLEKIFDVSFTMPEVSSSYMLLNQVFKELYNCQKISEFFKTIEFTNPRHIKKVLNKYQILLRFKNSSSVSNEHKALIPDILDKDISDENKDKGNIFETILTLYIIVLFEFYNDKFKELEDYKGKLNKYLLDYYNSSKVKSNGEFIDNIKTVYFKEIIFEEEKNRSMLKFICIFTPISKGNVSLYNDVNQLIDPYSFVQQFMSKEDRILYLFCNYILSTNNVYSFIPKNYNIFDIFKMAKTLL